MARVTTPSNADLATGIRGFLIRYRAMAYLTAVLLIILVFVGVPLQVADHDPTVVNVVGTMHGILYIVYLFAAFQLTRRLETPKWQMALILLAGTVPFCAFIAERKLTRRVNALNPPVGVSPKDEGSRATAFGRRWLSRRAVLLHVEVAIIAPGCVAAGWWQATRALAGNGLSWFYSVEWPVFAVLAIVGWWYLIHEDPAAYQARKRRRTTDTSSPAAPVSTVSTVTARLARALVLLTVVEFGLGIFALIAVPFSRPSGLRPARGQVVYVFHSSVGIILAIGAFVLLARTLHASRIARLTGWVGAIGIAVAGAGGLLTFAHSLRFAGVVLMLIGTITAGFGFVFPTLEKLRE